MLELIYAFEQGTLSRRPPASTPPLEGEAIPEPGSAVALIVFASVVLVVWQKPRWASAE